MRRIGFAILLCGVFALARPAAQALGPFPGYRLTFDNPAIDVSRAELHSPTVRLPVGLFGLLHDERNPLLYMTDRERFEASFDGLSALAQLARPYDYLLNPPESPAAVVLRIGSSSASLEDSEGNPIVASFSKSELFPIYSLYRAPPIVQISSRRSFMQLTHALHAGGSSPKVTPNPPLEKLLQGESAEDAGDLALELSTGGGIGAEERISAYSVIPGTGPLDSVVLAARLGAHYTAVLAELHSSVEVGIEHPGTESSLEGRMVYPGKGYSVGARLDVGSLFTAGAWYWGIGAGSVAAVDYTAEGVRVGEVPDSQLRHGPGVVPTFQLGVDGGGPVGIHANARMVPAPSGRLRFFFRPNPVSLQLSYEFAEKPTASVSLHVPAGVGRLVAGLNSRYSAFGDKPVYGVALSWELRSASRMWRSELRDGVTQ